MLTILGDGHHRTCAGVTRRELLRVGTLGIGGIALSPLLARAAGKGVVRDRAVVLLFLQGGPPSMETFDPRPDLPEGTRSCTGHLPTCLPGVSFAGNFPELAKRADRLAIVRNFASTDGGHNQLPVLTGRNAFDAPLGAVYAKGAGALHRRTGLPTNLVVLPESISPGLKLGQPTGPFRYDYILKNYLPAGKLGAQNDAFLPGGGSELMDNLRLRLPKERFDDRRGLLARIDGLRRTLDRAGDFKDADAVQQKAYDVLLRGVASAFDLSKEHPRTIAKYDTTGVFRMEDYHRDGKHFNGFVNQSRLTNLLGKQLLLARRLVESGAGVVTVVDGGWDFHADRNNPGVPVGMAVLGPQLDRAVSAFLDDLKDRGLSEKVLLVITGEMGRTARKNGKGGTGHNANLTPLVLAGGGLRMGQVIGASDGSGNAPRGGRYTPENLLATALQTLFDAGELRITPDAIAANVSKLITDGVAIKEVM